MSKIWIDLDNSPHVPLFRPLIRELEARGHSVTVTARDCSQVKPLLELFEVKATVIGRHYGKNKVLKVLGVSIRALQLAPAAFFEKPKIALSHGSRSQVMVARLLRIPSVLMADYEHARWVPGFHPDWLIVPEVLLAARQSPRRTALTYRGIKEDAYVRDFRPDASILASLGIGRDRILVTIRPPATEAHYHNPESEKLLASVIRHFHGQERVQMVILPRNERQAEQLRIRWAGCIKTGRVIFPEQALDGLNLIWFSDLVVSGGGTMNREAAALDVPVCTIFRGKLGAVDRHLADTGRLKLITTDSDVLSLRPQKRELPVRTNCSNRPALTDMVRCVEEVLHTLAAEETGVQVKRPARDDASVRRVSGPEAQR